MMSMVVSKMQSSRTSGHVTMLWLLVLLLLAQNHVVTACTNILVTPGASVDGSSIIAYNADAPTLMGMLYHYPATQDVVLPKNRSIYDWDTGKYLGEIAEVNRTYNVVGNTNEYGLMIGETTFGGVSLLAWNQTGAIMDYGSLIYVTLQRCKTVQEAMETMVYLMDTYGYASAGESFSLTDHSGQVWVMEVISRGSLYGKKGSVWVAQRIPDGMVSAHANQARIRTFPRDDPANCLYSEDVVDVAVFYGLYPADADPLLFSFSDTYDPLSFLAIRQGEARVWSIFSHIADTNGTFQEKYLKYALGEDFKNRMPLYVKPYKKLSMADVMEYMSSHYENTPMDSSIDVGAGLYGAPYRPRPLQWMYLNKAYHNERNIATSKTGWNFIGQVRPYMPPELSSIVWFGCDDSSTAPRVPIYGSSTRLSPAYYGKGPQDGVVQPLLEFDLSKAFWVQNMVSNLAYFRYKDIYPVVQRKLFSVYHGFLDNIVIVDQRALSLYYNSTENGTQKAIDYVSLYSVNAGNTLHKMWMEFYGELFVKYRDYYTIIPVADDPLCGCKSVEPGLSEAVKKRIVDETGSHYRVLRKKKEFEQQEPSTQGTMDGPVVYLGEEGPPKRSDHEQYDMDSQMPNHDIVTMVAERDL